MIKDFAVFILSHGRPDRVFTYNTLIKTGYTGPIYIIIDNEDRTAQQYRDLYGDKVIMFDKAAIAKTFDEGDNFGDRRSVIYARNASFEIARNLGITYFMELDDDYTNFTYRTNSHFLYINRNTTIRNLDGIFRALLKFYKSIPAKSIAIAQGGDYIGGGYNEIDKSILRRRKCMNTFICSTERPFQFTGRINEDVTTYTWFQNMGNLFITFPLVAINQVGSQSNSGGMTELYLDSGTYIKSFYTVMYFPSGVYIGLMGDPHMRLHHKVKWDHTVPYIIEEKYRKASKPFEIIYPEVQEITRNG